MLIHFEGSCCGDYDRPCIRCVITGMKSNMNEKNRDRLTCSFSIAASREYELTPITIIFTLLSSSSSCSGSFFFVVYPSPPIGHTTHCLSFFLSIVILSSRFICERVTHFYVFPIYPSTPSTLHTLRQTINTPTRNKNDDTRLPNTPALQKAHTPHLPRSPSPLVLLPLHLNPFQHYHLHHQCRRLPPDSPPRHLFANARPSPETPLSTLLQIRSPEASLA